MFNSAIDRPEYRKQSRPRIVTAFQNFRPVLIGLRRQLTPQCGNRVTLIVGFASQQQQAAFFRAQQEHQAHHNRQSRLVQLRWRNVAQKRPVAVFVGFIQALYQHFHRRPHLIAQRVRHFFRAIQRFIQECRKRIRRGAKESADTQQGGKRLEGFGFLKPQTRIPRNIPGGFPVGGIDQHPLFPVGKHPQTDIFRPAKSGHFVERRSRPIILTHHRV